MHAPVLAGDSLFRLRRRREPEVEPDEVERRPDPGDPCDHVQHAQDEVGEVSQVVRIHRFPRDRAELAQTGLELVGPLPLEPLAQHGQELGPRAAVHEDDELEAEALLVGLVQARELLEHVRLRATLLLGGLADPRMSRQRCDLVGFGQRERDVLRDLEWVLMRGELLDEPRPPREERRQLVGAQLPR